MLWLRRPGLAAGSLLLLAGGLGCGNQYRPVITPVNPTGPPSQGSAYIGIVSAVPPASSTAPPSPGIGTVIDFAGDSIAAQIVLGTTPLGFSQSTAISQAVTINSDGTLNTFAISPAVQTKTVGTSALLPGVGPYNILSTNSNYYTVERTATPQNAVAALSGSPPSLQQTLPMPVGLVTVVGRTAAQRVYAISQGVAGEACATPSAVTATGVATGIETADNSLSSSLTLGVCPVYGVQSGDGSRTFILNRGSGTVSVIDSQKNVLDNQNGGKNALFTVGGGPVYAELLDSASQLVTANYDSDTISVVDVTTDVYGNDSPQFGVTHTIHVGSHPTQVTILQDGTRAYVANSGDSTVSVVNLSTYTLEKNIPVAGTPRLISSIYSTPFGKVYVTSPDISTVTVIKTDSDTVSTSIQIQGNLIDLHVSKASITQNVSQNNSSYLAGAGVPCTAGTICASP